MTKFYKEFVGAKGKQREHGRNGFGSLHPYTIAPYSDGHPTMEIHKRREGRSKLDTGRLLGCGLAGQTKLLPASKRTDSNTYGGHEQGSPEPESPPRWDYPTNCHLGLKRLPSTTAGAGYLPLLVAGKGRTRSGELRCVLHIIVSFGSGY